MPLSYDHAIRAVQDCTYRKAPDEDLREMLRACMDINGPNPIAHHRISQAAEIIRHELHMRSLSGERTWTALIQAVNDLKSLAPEDHDVLLTMDDIRITHAEFLPPHSFFFEGIDPHGHETGMVVHFSQVKVRVVYLPKRNPTAPRIVTGFADGRAA